MYDCPGDVLVCSRCGVDYIGKLNCITKILEVDAFSAEISEYILNERKIFGILNKRNFLTENFENKTTYLLVKMPMLIYNLSVGLREEKFSHEQLREMVLFSIISQLLPMCNEPFHTRVFYINIIIEKSLEYGTAYQSSFSKYGEVA